MFTETTQAGHVIMPASAMAQVSAAVDRALRPHALREFERAIEPMRSTLARFERQHRVFAEMQSRIVKILDFHDRVLPWMNQFAHGVAESWSQPTRVHGLRMTTPFGPTVMV